MASRKWREKKVGYKTDGLSNEETNKQRRNKNDGVDSTAMEKNCNCHQSKIFAKKVSAGQRKQKKSERRRGGRHASGSWIARNRDDICA